MSSSIEDIIAEKMLNFMAYLTGVIGSKISEEDLRHIATKLEVIGNEIKESISDSISKIRYLEENNEFLQQQISNLTKEKENLISQVENLSNELKRVKRRYLGAKKKLKELEEIESKLSNNIEELKLKIRELEEENSKMAGKLAEFMEDNERLERENKDLKDRLVALENRCESLEKELRTFESRFLKAADIVRKELTADALEIRDAIRTAAEELKAFVLPQGRARLEKLSSLIARIHTKISSKDIGSAILRLIREGEV
ncbi:MAG: hypothetical protein NDP13_01925 [Crenarchaeota archaeon]|nr:hypothetical protein [Thermoproteota archaeon]